MIEIKAPKLTELTNSFKEAKKDAIPRVRFGLLQFLNYVADKARMKCFESIL